MLLGLMISAFRGRSVLVEARRTSGRAQTAPANNAHRRLGLMVSLTTLMFVLLPSHVGPPVNWWGGNLRLPVLMLLLLIPLGASSFLARRWFCRLAVGLNLGICLLATVDLVLFSQQEMKGFDEIVDVIPAGRRVSLLHWTPREVHEYPGEPHGYASNYYLFRKGGFVPQNVFEHPDVPVQRKQQGMAPPWGQAEYFDWARHGGNYDGFIVRVHPEYEHSPLHGVNQNRVELIEARGNWRYYKRRPIQNLRE